MVDVISSYKLFFADDLKLFLKIKSLKDRELLQEDINKLISWGTNNWLYLNKVKCFIVSYSKKEHILNFNYCIEGGSLSRLEIFKDQGVTFDRNFLFTNHIRYLSTRVFVSCFWFTSVFVSL